jgi:hypothetical protein
MIAPAWRGSDLFTQLTSALSPLIDNHNVRVVFGACEPHLLSYYCRFQRPCAQRNLSSPEDDYLIPLVSFLPGPEALVDQGRHPGMPRCVQAVLDGDTTVRSPLVGDPQTYWHDLLETLAALEPPVFDGLDPDELRICLTSSNTIRCAQADRILKTGGTARNIFVVLAGALEVNDGQHRIALLLPGDVFGETAYLLQQSRTANVDVLADNTRVLSLSERTLRSLARDHPGTATKLLENLAKILSQRLAYTHSN